MKHAHIDKDRRILGWYDSDIHTTIPTPNVEVDDDVWENAIDGNHNIVNQDGTTAIYDFRTEEEKIIDTQAKFRSDRDALISEADILTNKAIDNDKDATKLRVYRQALRDATIHWVMPNIEDYLTNEN